MLDPSKKQLQKILLCAPDYFGIDYVINPWMTEGLGKTDHARAVQQWKSLQRSLEGLSDLAFVAPEKGWPDMVFTANAGLVLGNQVIVSRFRARERQGEEPFFRAWFEKNGFEILPWPQDVMFEGAGDALFDRGQPVIWVAHGFRSDIAAAALVEKTFGRKAYALHLVDPRFYHLDTCFCPLTGGYLIYYPPAFDPESQARIAAHVPEDKRLIINEADALNFCCNAVEIQGHVLMNQPSTLLQDQLRCAGFTPVNVPVTEFLKSGGAVKCLTLKLIEK